MDAKQAPQDFSEAVKKEARRLAAFKCCYCRDRQGDEVHHLEPKEEGGPNTLDNAILLCAQCHTDYGHRSDKRKQLRQARDDWYEIVHRRWEPKKMEEVAEIATLAAERATERLEERLNNIFGTLMASYHSGRTSSQQVANVATTMINSIALTGDVLFGRPPNTYCLRCNQAYETRPGDPSCPYCGHSDKSA